VAKADRQPARKYVYLKVVIAALRELGLSEESITRGIFRRCGRCCGDGSISFRHTGAAPPPGFWGTDLHNVRFVGSDIKNMMVLPADVGAVGLEEITLSDVELVWEDVIAAYPALRDTESSQRSEVTLAELPQRPLDESELLEPMEWLAKVMKTLPRMRGESKNDWAKRLLPEMNKYYGGEAPWTEATLRRRMNDLDRK
jgi:hypothetical protein